MLTFVVYRLAQGPRLPRSAAATGSTSIRRTILTALFAFLLFLPILLFGFANDWPRVWRIFGIVNGLALVFFAAIGDPGRAAAVEAPPPRRERPRPAARRAGTDEAAGKPLS